MLTHESGGSKSIGSQRRLEAWVAQHRTRSPRSSDAIAVVQLAHEELSEADGDRVRRGARELGLDCRRRLFSQTERVPRGCRWAPGARVAYFLVDALRYEMGVELRDQLQGAEELTIRAAVAMLPTITPVGMAALLPGASASFSVVESKEKLAARVEQTVMPGLAERMKFFKAKVPDIVDLPLDKVLASTSSKLKTAVGDASLILVRSQEIDFAGELDTGGLARQVMDIGDREHRAGGAKACERRSRAVRRERGPRASVRFAERRRHAHRPARWRHRGTSSAMWIGTGRTRRPPGTIRVSAAELGYDSELDFVFPNGLGVLQVRWRPHLSPRRHQPPGDGRACCDVPDPDGIRAHAKGRSCALLTSPRYLRIASSAFG